MLKITIPSQELYDEASNKVIKTKETTLQLEHSLVSISKWEAKYKKPFISYNNVEKTLEETIDYIKCMTITQNVDPNIYNYLTVDNINDIKEYIDSPMTATTIKEQNKTSKREVITSEILYYWMIANEIPFECEKWHLNRLLMLIRVCSIKNQPSKKMSKGEILSRNAALNAKRRKPKLH